MHLYRIVVWNYRLSVIALQLVSVGEVPGSCLAGLVVFEHSFEIGAVGKDPAASNDFVLEPLSNQPHSSVTVSVAALAMLLSELPPP